MKINDTNVGGASAAETHRKQDIQQTERASAGKTSAAGGHSPDRVELSGTLGRLSQALSSFQTDRANRVQSLTAQYQKGSYQPNSQATSHGVVGEALAAPGH
jgi:hypothetical protein